jgi:hypothetical protein
MSPTASILPQVLPWHSGKTSPGARFFGSRGRPLHRERFSRKAPPSAFGPSPSAIHMKFGALGEVPKSIRVTKFKDLLGWLACANHLIVRHLLLITPFSQLLLHTSNFCLVQSDDMICTKPLTSRKASMWLHVLVS